jgi:hypothetical protein
VKCSQCGLQTYVIHIDGNHDRLCGECVNMDKFAWTEKLRKLRNEIETLKESDRMLKRIEFIVEKIRQPGERIDRTIERLVDDRILYL